MMFPMIYVFKFCVLNRERLKNVQSLKTHALIAVLFISSFAWPRPHFFRSFNLLEVLIVLIAWN